MAMKTKPVGTHGRASPQPVPTTRIWTTPVLSNFVDSFSGRRFKSCHKWSYEFWWTIPNPGTPIWRWWILY